MAMASDPIEFAGDEEYEAVQAELERLEAAYEKEQSEWQEN